MTTSLESRNPYGDSAPDRQRVIDDVLAQAQMVCMESSCAIAPVLESCVEDTVTRLWAGRIHTWVPVLALRDVQECIRAGQCPPPDGR